MGDTAPVRKYIIRRLLLFIPTLLGVSLGIFVLLRVIPGDVAALILAGPGGELTYSREDYLKLREEIGLNQPIYAQYLDWMWRFVRGDLGNSLVTQKPMAEEMKRQFPVTFQLGFFSIFTIALIALPIGVLAAVKQDSWVDYVFRGFAVLGLATPSFFVALLVILVLSVWFNWSAPLGFVPMWKEPAKSIQQLVFPALALGLSSSGLLVRLTRAQLLEVLREDYVRTARAKGLAEPAVVLRHGLRNALLPVVTIAGAQVGIIFTGTVIIESIFNLPGVGRGLITALNGRDLPAIQFYVLYFELVALSANLLVDLTYGWLDPRIRYE